ncbi:MAG: flavin reductase family protein [Euryarchaeota archaeon]|nr:flavin reductase family protein [Euryarchaeota archaeon]
MEMELNPAAFYKLNARCCVVVSTASPRGISNAAPFSFNMPVSFSPPIFAIASNPGHDTWRNIRETREFVVNFVGEELGEKMHILERDYPYEVSEIKEAGLTEVPSKKVKAPRIGEAYAWLECSLYDAKELGDHVLIAGEVLLAEVRDECYDRVVDVARAKPLLHISGEYFGVPLARKFRRA